MSFGSACRSTTGTQGSSEVLCASREFCQSRSELMSCLLHFYFRLDYEDYAGEIIAK